MSEHYSSEVQWTTTLVLCTLCTHQWVAVYPAGTALLECPHCHYMVDFEVIKTKEE